MDRSARAPGVFDVAAQIVGALGAKAFLFEAIVVPPDFPPGAATALLDPLPEYLMNESRTHLTALANRAPAIQCETRVERSASPWRSILAMAQTVDADLIVVGSHGYEAWDRIIGTNAAQVANRAERSVLVVHDRNEAPAASRVGA